MDTDDLSNEAYAGIIIEAEKLSHDLTLHFGLLSYDSKNEEVYLNKAQNLAEQILKIKDHQMEDFFWGNPPDKDQLLLTIKKIIFNIKEIKRSREKL
jgi:hypothetical protein